MIRHSGLQKEVLKMYRIFMKEISKKPVETREELKIQVRENFKLRKNIPIRDIQRIEHWLRYAKRQLDIFKLTETDGMF